MGDGSVRLAAAAAATSILRWFDVREDIIFDVVGLTVVITRSKEGRTGGGGYIRTVIEAYAAAER